MIGRARQLVARISALFVVCASPVDLGCRPVDDPAGKSWPAPVPSNRPPDKVAASPEEQPVVGVTLPNFAAIAERVAPSVVTVVSTVGTLPTNKAKRHRGSGMIVSSRGQVLTNAHVVAGASEIDVELGDHRRVPAKVIYGEPILDLALLELEQPVSDLQPVSFRTRAAMPGEWVMAVGQPFGLGNTVTVGVISGLGRDHDDLDRPGDLRTDGIWSFIQTDASINLGNSGGPLVDVHGEVLGLTTAVRSDGQGVAFAIPAPMARKFLDEVWTYGRVRMARLGIRAVDIGPDQFPGRLSAVAITQVAEDGPGARAGLEVGDVVLAIDDQAVSRVSQVAYLTQLHGVGAQVEMQVKRGEEPVKRLQVIPTEVP